MKIGYREARRSGAGGVSEQAQGRRGVLGTANQQVSVPDVGEAESLTQITFHNFELIEAAPECFLCVPSDEDQVAIRIALG